MTEARKRHPTSLSYGVSAVRILEKNDRVYYDTHCINPYQHHTDTSERIMNHEPTYGLLIMSQLFTQSTVALDDCDTHMWKVIQVISSRFLD